ncbi:M20/M25/M40 family metallo-hydrolase [Oceanobacillus kimchii]|uniref:M20/M25/M40 family metallo-hydrolase n=1 Tax=Oceanobacillus kimchii TaxID=746691 RepID=UPI000345FB86|nr:M20/M25/M40 family metallo-hydrolase [Oceanobacillus kimchii]MCT1578941.1 M20/M25/M40 family metallo-hydrolase [Oceanobacillus kimchii]MCT2137866.1 M20/M25/M40 family metallo-hydrolase [Oceanobacillus kimchii]
MEEVFERLLEKQEIKRTLEFIHQDEKLTLKEQIQLTEIPAPPFKEQKRAIKFQKMLIQHGLEHVHIDEEGNVFGIRKGTGNGPRLVISAHLDTVFPEGTDTRVSEKEGKFFAPGIGDDTRGLAEVLSIVRALTQSNINTIGDIIIGGTVGEEGAGDLRGIKAYFNKNKADGYISIDGPNLEAITYLGTGSYRYEITYSGSGGHSFADFGTPSATHALGRAIAEISNIVTTSDPKTTFSVGPITGGSSVNAISETASMQVDLRSNSKSELDRLDEKFQEIVKEACEAENRRWESNTLTVDIHRFGNRPPAQQSEDLPIVCALQEAIIAVGKTPVLSGPSSTDANYPMSIGIPSITSGTGGQAGGAHTLQEWYDPKDGYLAVQKNFLLILGLVGIKDEIKPILKLLS